MMVYRNWKCPACGGYLGGFVSSYATDWPMCGICAPHIPARPAAGIVASTVLLTAVGVALGILLVAAGPMSCIAGAVGR